MNQVRAQEWRNQVQQQITVEEAAVISEWLLEYYAGVSRTDLLLNKTMDLSADQHDQIDRAVERINRQEPVQYVLGEAHFYGRPFKVSSDVLIPRRETEELVAMVVKENPRGQLRVLDIGTGSGCIAISLAEEMRDAEVHALDISKTALAVAQQNIRFHHSSVHLIQGDVLHDTIAPPTPFDIIVSNPPYVTRREASEMMAKVIDYEPHEALFVEDHDPLVFYDRIASVCHRGWLRRGGHVYCEINENMGEQLKSLWRQSGFLSVTLRKDMQGKDRFIVGKLAE